MSKQRLRPSQIITTFGPGSIVDLPDDSVMIAGIEHWFDGYKPKKKVSEPRLQAAESAVVHTGAVRRGQVVKSSRELWEQNRAVGLLGEIEQTGKGRSTARQGHVGPALRLRVQDRGRHEEQQHKRGQEANDPVHRMGCNVRSERRGMPPEL